jgi:hypothetical protein
MPPELTLTVDQAAAHTSEAERRVAQAVDVLGGPKINGYGCYADPGARVRELRAARETIQMALDLIEGARWPSWS